MTKLIQKHKTLSQRYREKIECASFGIDLVRALDILEKLIEKNKKHDEH